MHWPAAKRGAELSIPGTDQGSEEPTRCQGSASEAWAVGQDEVRQLQRADTLTPRWPERARSPKRVQEAMLAGTGSGGVWQASRLPPLSAGPGPFGPGGGSGGGTPARRRVGGFRRARGRKQGQPWGVRLMAHASGASSAASVWPTEGRCGVAAAQQGGSVKGGAGDWTGRIPGILHRGRGFEKEKAERWRFLGERSNHLSLTAADKKQTSSRCSWAASGILTLR